MARRRKRKIQGGKTYAFVVDGQTEVWYLQMLKRNERELKIDIKPELPNKKSLEEQYRLVEERAQDYTKVFWIVDYDVIRRESIMAKKGTESSEQLFIKLRNKAQKVDNVVVIVNDPCLEFWFLLHYKKTSRLFTECSAAEKQLVKYLEDYEKTEKYFTKQGQDIYLKLKGRLGKAVEHAEDLGPFDPYYMERAVCEMYLLFKTPEIWRVIMAD